MIEFNAIVPRSDAESVRTLEGSNFRIIHGSRMNRTDAYYFLIDAEEEDLIMFTLKYGPENVWKR